MNSSFLKLFFLHNSPVYLEFALFLLSILINLFSIHRLPLVRLAQFACLSAVCARSSFYPKRSFLNLSFTLASYCTVRLFICSLRSFFILSLKIFSQSVVYPRFFLHSSPVYLQFTLVFHSILIDLFSICRLSSLLRAQFPCLSAVSARSSFYP